MSSDNSDLLNFIQSRIDENTKLLAIIHGGPRALSKVPDLDGSYSEGSGVPAQFALCDVNHPAHVHANVCEASEQPDHYQGEAVELGECAILE